ncbi:MAG TPA: uracil-DNA glycosylase family protein [Patescibacteria group bacterium]|nr:uracil-DNA glycosylase family protein [Patescibacteria group bacterium]
MKRVIFVGQAMPKVKRTPHDWPTLNAWLFSIGITQRQIEDNFLYTALVDYFPGAKNGSHLVPTEEEIKKERKRLEKIIKDFDPEIVVTIGKLSLSYCLNCEVGVLNEFIGKTFETDPYSLLGKNVKIIPLAHPSGASTWHKKPENRKLLNKALNLLKENL